MFGNLKPLDWQQLGLTAGLSMLGNNDGSKSFGQLVGNAGLDALAGLQARKQYEASMARQQAQDDMERQKHELAMKQGQMEMDEATKKAELMKRWQAGDQSVYPILFPEQWAQDRRQEQAHAHALKVAAMNEAKNGKKGTYDPKLGLMVYQDGTTAPIQMPEGHVTPKQQAQEYQKKLAGGIVLDDVKTAKELAKNYNILPETGFTGWLTGFIPGTDAYNLQRTVESIGANIASDRLQTMRENSPTGGALGNVTDKDMDLMMAAYGSLKTSQSEAQFLRNLERVETVYADIVYGKGNWRRNEHGEIEVGLGIGKIPLPSSMGGKDDDELNEYLSN